MDLSQFNISYSEPRPLRKAADILEAARNCWYSRRPFRERRQRSRDYYRGKPNEIMPHPDTGQPVHERDYVASQGRIPMTLNKIRPAMDNLKGQFRQNKSQRMAFGRNRQNNAAAEMMTEALRIATDINEASEVDADQFEEAGLSGMFGWKTGYKWHAELNREDISIDPLKVDRIFFNPDLNDRRTYDLTFIGELHDITMEKVIELFARNSIEEKRLRSYYATARDSWYTHANTLTGFDAAGMIDFYSNGDYTKCRVIEAWRLEHKWRRFIFDRTDGSYEPADMTDAEIATLNAQRQAEYMAAGLQKEDAPLISIDTRYEGVWRCYWLTPDGDVLFESDTPYWHESHPYTLGFASFIDGEIWGFIEDLIDQQRLINRITSAMDYMFAAGAKGVLMVPEDAIPQGKTPQDFADEYTKFNGVIVYKQRPGSKPPFQVTTNSIPAGLFTWLATLNNELREVSGITTAAQGLEPPSGTPASLYQAQVLQSSLTNRNLFDTFFAARKKRDLKVCRLIAQYYDTERFIPLERRALTGDKFVTYDPKAVRDIEWDIVLSDTADSPAARMANEEHLKTLLNEQRLTFRQYLQLSPHPQADMVLAVIEQSNPVLKAMGDTRIGPEGVAMLQTQLGMAAKGGDKDAMATLQQAQ